MLVQDCKNLKVDHRHPDGAKYCQYCGHFCLVDLKNKCQCCNKQVKIYTKKLTELKRFNKIIDENQGIIEAYLANPSRPDYQAAWSIRLGFINYFVPIKYVAEYYELDNLEGENKYEDFIQAVKDECTVLPRFMHSIK